MNNVVRPAQWWSDQQPPQLPPEPPDMEARVAKLEALAEKAGERLVAIEKDVALIRQKQDEFTQHYATKADLTEAKNSIIVWVVAAVFLAQLLPVVGGLVKQFFR